MMRNKHLEHAWDVSPGEAIAIQQRLRDEVVTEDTFGMVRYIAGVDVGFEEGGAVTRAAVAVLDFPELELHEHSIVRRPTSFPYVPGLLSFREAPAVLDALDQLHTTPDLLLCDGQGTAHPRRFGIACHLGVLTGLPAVGVAKSLLVGRFAPLPDERGAWQPLVHQGDVIGVALRTRPKVQPVYVSPGHRISLDSAIDFVLRCTRGFRLPETTRWAHRLASHKG